MHNCSRVVSILLGPTELTVLGARTPLTEFKASAGDDWLDGGAGNDLLTGGEGNDFYAFGLGYGNDTVDETGALSTDDDFIYTTLTQDQITVTRSGADLVIAINGSADTLRLARFDDPANRIAGLYLYDAIWDRETLAGRSCFWKSEPDRRNHDFRSVD
jgi:Ca2+-binding RTX toxin-like protein